jgi:hypothetical protein
LQATHLLVPQIENSIRHVLNQRGLITTTLRNGIQKERDINDLLPSDDVKQIFGEDLVFDLRGILIERFGHNLRNKSAHGLMPEEEFYDASSVYLWWLMLHISWNAFLTAHSPSAAPQVDQKRNPVERVGKPEGADRLAHSTRCRSVARTRRNLGRLLALAASGQPEFVKRLRNATRDVSCGLLAVFSIPERRISVPRARKARHHVTTLPATPAESPPAMPA